MRLILGRLSKLQQQYNEAFGTIQEQKQLITQLEEDLRAVNALSAMFRGTAEGVESSQLLGTDSEALVVAEAVKDISATSSSVLSSAADSLLPIVQSQRERFRIRAQELEVQVTAHQQQVQLLQNEMDKLRSDNVKLYEKIKFLQTYPSKTSGPSDDLETRYSTHYEEQLDPFSSFNRKERQRRYMSLKPYDKITLSMGRFIMGNKTARTVTFFYTCFLHLLVFLVLYKMAYTSTDTKSISALCQAKFAQHMADVHNDHDFHMDD